MDDVLDEANIAEPSDVAHSYKDALTKNTFLTTTFEVPQSDTLVYRCPNQDEFIEGPEFLNAMIPSTNKAAGLLVKEIKIAQVITRDEVHVTFRNGRIMNEWKRQHQAIHMGNKIYTPEIAKPLIITKVKRNVTIYVYRAPTAMRDEPILKFLSKFGEPLSPNMQHLQYEGIFQGIASGVRKITLESINTQAGVQRLKYIKGHKLKFVHAGQITDWEERAGIIEKEKSEKTRYSDTRKNGKEGKTETDETDEATRETENDTKTNDSTDLIELVVNNFIEKAKSNKPHHNPVLGTGLLLTNQYEQLPIEEVTTILHTNGDDEHLTKSPKPTSPKKRKTIDPLDMMTEDELLSHFQTQTTKETMEIETSAQEENKNDTQNESPVNDGQNQDTDGGLNFNLSPSAITNILNEADVLLSNTTKEKDDPRNRGRNLNRGTGRKSSTSCSGSGSRTRGAFAKPYARHDEPHKKLHLKPPDPNKVSTGN